MHKNLQPVRPKLLRRWLSTPDSLSQRLAALGSPYRVNPLRQGSLRLLPTERQLGRTGPGARYWGREVLLCVDGQPLVFARSVTLARAAQGPWRALRALGSRPLADILFGKRSASRQALTSLRIRPGSPWYNHIRRRLPDLSNMGARRGSLWMRRSLYQKSSTGPVLLVQEVFLPAIYSHVYPDIASSTCRGARWYPGTGLASRGNLA